MVTKDKTRKNIKKIFFNLQLTLSLCSFLQLKKCIFKQNLININKISSFSAKYMTRNRFYKKNQERQNKSGVTIKQLNKKEMFSIVYNLHRINNKS